MTSGLEEGARGARVAAAAVAASGRPVIGIVGRDVPSLLVAATGALPTRLAPVEENTAEADALMGRAVDRAAGRVLASVLNGSLDFLAGIFISRDSEASVRLFYTLQELNRRGRLMVPVHLVDQVHQNRESTVRFNVGQLEQMWRVAESWAEAAITTPSLEQALAGLLEVRLGLEQARSDRRAGRRSGTACLHGYRAAQALPPEEASRMLHEESAPPASVDLPLFLTGSAPLGDEVYRAIEEAGATIVGEDHDWGDPLLSDVLPDTVDDDRESFLRRLALTRLRGAPASASSTMAARADATAANVRDSGARALLSVVRSYDDGPAWDWRHQRERAGVPAALVRGEQADDLGEVVTAVLNLKAAS